MDVRCCFIQERVIEMFLVLGPLMVTGARLIAASTEFEQFLIFLNYNPYLCQMWAEIWGFEFSSYEIELQNRVTQNDGTLRVTNSKIVIEILLLSYWLGFIKY